MELNRIKLNGGNQMSLSFSHLLLGPLGYSMVYLWLVPVHPVNAWVWAKCRTLSELSAAFVAFVLLGEAAEIGDWLCHERFACASKVFSLLIRITVIFTQMPGPGFSVSGFNVTVIERKWGHHLCGRIFYCFLSSFFTSQEIA